MTSQTSSEEEWMNRDTVKPTVTFGSRAGFKKGTLRVFTNFGFAPFHGGFRALHASPSANS